jgi:hypothetical protein
MHMRRHPHPLGLCYDVQHAYAAQRLYRLEQVHYM